MGGVGPKDFDVPPPNELPRLIYSNFFMIFIL